MRNYVRTHSKIHFPTFGSIIVQTVRSSIPAVIPYFVLAPRARAHWSPIPRLAVLDRHGEISREHLCMYLSGFLSDMASHDIHAVTGPRWKWRDWLRRGMYCSCVLLGV